MPVPASTMMISPAPERTEAHGVCPPYRVLSFPGDGNVPRTPQN